jgi:hypothetical protein
MSHEQGIDTTALAASVAEKITRPLPGWMRPFFLACAAIGAITFMVLAGSLDPDRAWRIYHLNWLYWTGLSMGLVLFGAATTVAKGRWAVPLRRIGEASVAFLPLSLVLFLLSWVGRARIYSWIAQPIVEPHVKAFWLRDSFMYGRVTFGLLLLFGIAGYFVYLGVRQDVADMKNRLPAKFRPLYDRITAGWDDATGFVVAGEKRATIGPLVILTYAAVMSLIAFDTIMSLSPHWVSNLLGAFFFMGAWLSGLMGLALLTILWRRHFGIEDVITTKHLHDLGKLCFGFTVFWAYLLFSQFIVIWYGNMPEETQFLFLRMTRPEWKGISIAMIVMCFLVPFWGLIGAAPKKTPAIFGTFAVVSLCGLWVDRFVLVVPSVMQTSPGLPLGWQEVLITVGFFGVWGLSYLWFAERFPLVSPPLIRNRGERRAHAHIQKPE